MVRTIIQLPGGESFEDEGSDSLSPSELYHENSKYFNYQGLSFAPDERLIFAMSRGFKVYHSSKRIPLPREYPISGQSLEEVIWARRTVRQFSGKSIEPVGLSKILHLSYGLTGINLGSRHYWPLRAAPSAGALYPIEIYVAALNVSEIEPGLYHYSVLDHALECLGRGDFRGSLYSLCMCQDFLKSAPVALILTAVFSRTRIKYGERAYRFVLIDTGHVGQNIYLAATACGLGAVTVGGFYDDEVNDLLNIDGVNESAVYLAAVGWPT